MKLQFRIPPGTHMEIDLAGRVTLIFRLQSDAEEFFKFIKTITCSGTDAEGKQALDTILDMITDTDKVQ